MGCCGSGSQEPKQKNSDQEKIKSEGKDIDRDKIKSEGKNNNRDKIKSESGTTKKGLVIGLALVLIAGISFGYFIKPSAPTEDHLAMIKSKDVVEQRGDFIALANNIKAEMAKQGKYNCCIENPCTYCIIEETPEHGEGAACECMDAILNGRHPCGECIGEILEGNGEEELVPYFAKAIAHKVGAQHEEHLQDIIDDMYPEEPEE